jgi:hypothetical protein
MSYLPVWSRRWAAPVWGAMFCRRMYRRTTCWAFGLALVAGLVGTDMAQAAPPSTFTATVFEPTIVVAGMPLQLNGAGTRFRAVFRVYDLALYTTKKVSTAAELLAVSGPKRLQFTALRDLPTTDLGRMFFRGMGDNATKAQMQLDRGVFGPDQAADGRIVWPGVRAWQGHHVFPTGQAPGRPGGRRGVLSDDVEHLGGPVAA